MRRGFSLIELLVVVAILAMLVGVAAPYYSDYVKDAKFGKAKADLDIIKSAMLLYNSQEDMAYEGITATITPYLPIFGNNDFIGLQGKYLSNVPVDPWGKSYKLDPYGKFVYSEGPDSSKTSDDIREYYVKELALTKIEWQDLDSDRAMSLNDKVFFQFNKSVRRVGGLGNVTQADFDFFQNGQATTTVLMSFAPAGADVDPTYLVTQATFTTIVATVSGVNGMQVGVHSMALKDDPVILQNYREVILDRGNTSYNIVKTTIETTPANQLDAGIPLRRAVRTMPLKVIPKQ